MKAKAQLGTVP